MNLLDEFQQHIKAKIARLLDADSQVISAREALDQANARRVTIYREELGVAPGDTADLLTTVQMFKKCFFPDEGAK